MAKRIVWTNTAKNARRDILEYWIKYNGSNTYSKHLSIVEIQMTFIRTWKYDRVIP